MSRVLAMLTVFLPAVAAAQQMPLRYYGQQNGLANLAITTMTRDHAGYLWIGTENGLFRYNGADFQRYGLAEGLDEPMVIAMLVDHEDKLWIGTQNGLFLKVGERLLPVLRDDGRKIDMGRGQSLGVSPNGGRYIVTGQTVYTLALRDGKTQVRPVFSMEQIKQYAELDSISSVFPEAGTALWLGCGKSLCHSGPEGVAVWGAAQGVPADTWRSILRDRSGQLWARGDHNIVALPSGARHFINRTPSGDVLRKNNFMPVMAEDSQGRVLSNVDDGLVRWNQTRWERFGPANGLRSAGGINALQFDPDGGLWLGSLGLGLINWLGYGNWENWTSAQGLPDNVVLSFVRSPAGVLYIGTRSGLASMPTGGERFVPAAANLPKDQWSALALDEAGQVWGSTYSGVLARLAADGSGSVHVRGLPRVNELTADRKQRLWLATFDGVAVADIGGRTPSVRPPEGLVQPTGDAIVHFNGQCQDPRGTLWFISQRELLQLDGAHWSRHVLHQPDGDADWSAISCSSDGSLWLSDARGSLWRANLGQQGWQLNHVDNRLLHNASVINMHEDRRGWLWIGTDAGIAIWNREHWRFFNQNDGLTWNDTNGSVFYEDADGSMWIATSNGASHVLRPELLFAPQQLGVRIEAARYNAQPLALKRSWTLPWSNAPLELELASLHYQNRDALRFHYRLAGLESGWVESAVPQLRYAVLPPGDYRFEYYASDAYSHRISPVEKLSVTVLPPWWRTMSFYLLCGVSTLLLLALVYRLRVRHLLQRQLLTEQLVRERTRELELSREQLRQRALRDALTGAWNRGAIMEIIEHALEQAITHQQPLLLVLLDLDHFKRINDNYGHSAGDAVLRETVVRLSTAIRQTDAVGRYGGEEFLVLLPGLDRAGGHGRVEELRHVIRCAPIAISEQQSITVTASFGAIAFDPRRPLPVAELIDRADQALYRSKENGRDRIDYAPVGD